MEVIQNIIALIVALGVLITVHEYGHFWVARRCGIKVLRFSIGFGSTLLSWKDKHGTEFVVAALPLGGYVRMLDEREAEVPEELRSQAFNNKSVWQRIAVVVAGPLVNLGFAVLLYWVMFVNGVTGVIPTIGGIDVDSLAEQSGLDLGQEIVAVDGKETPSWEEVNFALISRLGDSGTINIVVQETKSSLHKSIAVPIDLWMVGKEKEGPMAALGIHSVRPPLEPVIGGVVDDSPADRAGFLALDQVTQVNGADVDSWQAWVKVIQANPNTAMDVLVQRQGIDVLLSVVPDRVLVDEAYIGRIGARPEVPKGFGEDQQRIIKYSLLDAVGAATNKCWERMVLTYQSIWKMIRGLISLDNLSGPITIAQIAGNTAEYGLEAFLGFIAYLSISLGVLNLLPIPVLDGGHLMYFLVESITGKSVSERIQAVGIKVGLSAIFALMLLALYNDIVRVLA